MERFCECVITHVENVLNFDICFLGNEPHIVVSRVKGEDFSYTIVDRNKLTESDVFTSKTYPCKLNGIKTSGGYISTSDPINFYRKVSSVVFVKVVEIKNGRLMVTICDPCTMESYADQLLRKYPDSFQKKSR